MLRKCVFAFVVVAFSVGVLSGAEMFGVITKVDGKKITFKEFKEGKKGETKDAATLTVAEKVMVMKGAKKGEEPTKLTGGLTHDMFKTIGEKGVRARITTNDSGQVTEILTMGGKGKGGKKKDTGN